MVYVFFLSFFSPVKRVVVVEGEGEVCTIHKKGSESDEVLMITRWIGIIDDGICAGSIEKGWCCAEYYNVFRQIPTSTIMVSSPHFPFSPSFPPCLSSLMSRFTFPFLFYSSPPFSS